MRNLQTNSTTTTKFRSTDSVEILITDHQRLEFSYVDRDCYHFMHPETFEDTVHDESFVEGAKRFLAEGNTYEILFIEGRAMQIQLPSAVELKVTDAPDAVRGDTSGAALKPVTVETGMVVQTPLFVKTADVIKVRTADSSYLGRA